MKGIEFRQLGRTTGLVLGVGFTALTMFPDRVENTDNNDRHRYIEKQIKVFDDGDIIDMRGNPAPGFVTICRQLSEGEEAHLYEFGVPDGKVCINVNNSLLGIAEITEND